MEEDEGSLCPLSPGSSIEEPSHDKLPLSYLEMEEDGHPSISRQLSSGKPGPGSTRAACHTAWHILTPLPSPPRQRRFQPQGQQPGEPAAGGERPSLHWPFLRSCPRPHRLHTQPL